MARFLKSRTSIIDKAPGTITFIGRQKMEKPRFRLMTFNKEELDEFENESLDELLQNRKEGRINWINIDGLHDQNVILKIGEQFDLSPLVQEDIVNTDQRPKAIEDGENLVVFLKQLNFDDSTKSIHADQITIILGENYVISFQERVGEFFNPIRNRIRQNIGRVRTSQPDYLFYRIIDTIVDNYMVCVGAMGELVEANEENVLSKVSKEIVEDIYRHKTEISYIRKAVRPAIEVSRRLKSIDSKLIKKSTRPFFDDLDDLLTHTFETIEVYHTMISDQLNIYNTNLSNSANDVMKVLTIFAAIFIPLTFIAGIYGTNFEYVPELQFRYSYFIMWGVMIVMAVIMLIYFKRKKWL